MTKEEIMAMYNQDLNEDNLENETNNRITINQSLQNFPNYLFLNGNAQSTALTYVSDVKQFHEFIKTKLNNRIRYIDNIDKSVTELYKKHLSKKLLKGEYKPATVERKYNSIKVFCQFLESDYGIKDYTKGDAFGNKGHLKDWNNKYEVKELPKFIEDYEIEKLYRTMDKSNDMNIFRDRAVIETLLCTGCRRSELLRLKWEDIDFFQEEITIRRKKGSDSSIISVPSYLIGSLTSLKNLDGNLCISEYVFRGRGNSTQLSTSALASLVKKWVNKSNISTWISPHNFRHTFITTCFRNGIPIELILKYTGHKDINSLKVYTHLVASDTKKVSSLFEGKRNPQY